MSWVGGVEEKMNKRGEEYEEDQEEMRRCKDEEENESRTCHTMVFLGLSQPI